MTVPTPQAEALIQELEYAVLGFQRAGNLDRVHKAKAALLAALTTHAGADGWVKVSTEPPPCDGETMFIGENDAGYIACFNSMTPDGYCFHESAESSICVMSGLRHWKRVDLPAPPAPEALEVP